ncbi:MAG: tRNA (5-methylaminomethyl-2-thiouridine)(34)-methyltransferase MnmD [Crocinitomicaceae bacterium]|nr:tRNA (5-methylaminomethyl-2-thiouridine)(34)-methyltransferase MnmD [Crocinitomicaceae bacterium]
MKLRVFTTGDGSSSVYNETLGETYHSRYGAVQESRHIFIESGLKQMKSNKNIHLLEVGFGTGLNALLTLALSKEFAGIHYTALEVFPLDADVYTQLSFDLGRGEVDAEDLLRLHQSEWEIPVKFSDLFFLEKKKCALESYSGGNNEYDLVYFDAFAPDIQPRLWERAIFCSLFQWMKQGGILVTYCAKGQVRRDMQEAGFKVERLSGPVGKREMLRAVKPVIDNRK